MGLRERELLELEQRIVQRQGDRLLLGSLIHSYLDQFPDTSGSKRRHLEFLAKQLIAAEDVRQLTAAKLVEHTRLRRAQGVSPGMAFNDLLWIGTVLEATRSVHGGIVSPTVARCVAHKGSLASARD